MDGAVQVLTALLSLGNDPTRVSSASCSQPWGSPHLCPPMRRALGTLLVLSTCMEPQPSLLLPFGVGT